MRSDLFRLHNLAQSPSLSQDLPLSSLAGELFPGFLFSMQNHHIDMDLTQYIADFIALAYLKLSLDAFRLDALRLSG